MTRFVDRISLPSGRLVLDIFEHGRLIEHFEEDNLVVHGMQVAMTSLLGGGAGAVTQIGFGTNGSTPAHENSALAGAFLKAIGTVEYPSETQVKFNFTLENVEANGMAILEFGLLTAADVLVARKIRASALNKNIALSITGAWIITF